MLQKVRILARKSFTTPDTQLIILAEGVGNTFWRAKPIEFIERNPAEQVDAALTLDETESQMLMNELWDCGIRPSEGTGSAGALAATQKHLEDMRQLTNKLVDRVLR